MDKRDDTSQPPRNDSQFADPEGLVERLEALASDWEQKADAPNLDAETAFAFVDCAQNLRGAIAQDSRQSPEASAGPSNVTLADAVRGIQAALTAAGRVNGIGVLVDGDWWDVVDVLDSAYARLRSSPDGNDSQFADPEGLVERLDVRIRSAQRHGEKPVTILYDDARDILARLRQRPKATEPDGCDLEARVAVLEDKMDDVLPDITPTGRRG